MSSESKILVTGFEPFAGETLNPSSLILKKICEDQHLSQCCDVLFLPVTFQTAHRPVIEKLNSNIYKAWVGFGQAGGRAGISLERVAINWAEADITDNEGVKPVPSLLSENFERAYFSEAPLEKMKSVLDLAGIKCEISFTAGAYVCNSLYFHVLSHIKAPVWGLFVHVPYLPEQVKDKTDKPSMELLMQWQAAQLILTTALHSES